MHTDGAAWADVRLAFGGKAWQPKFSTGWERSPGESALFREVIESQQCRCVVSQSGDGMD